MLDGMRNMTVTDQIIIWNCVPLGTEPTLLFRPLWIGDISELLRSVLVQILRVIPTIHWILRQHISETTQWKYLNNTYLKQHSKNTQTTQLWNNTMKILGQHIFETTQQKYSEKTRTHLWNNTVKILSQHISETTQWKYLDNTSLKQHNKNTQTTHL